jgi:hypothetical protein
LIFDPCAERLSNSEFSFTLFGKRSIWKLPCFLEGLFVWAIGRSLPTLQSDGRFAAQLGRRAEMLSNRAEWDTLNLGIKSFHFRTMTGDRCPEMREVVKSY